MIRVERIFIGAVFFVLGKLIDFEIDLETLRIISLMGIAAAIVASFSVVNETIKKLKDKKKCGFKINNNIKMGDRSVLISSRQATIRSISYKGHSGDPSG